MKSAQQLLCRIYLHPSICSSRTAIGAIQQQTGLLIVTTQSGYAQAIRPTSPTTGAQA